MVGYYVDGWGAGGGGEGRGGAPGWFCVVWFGPWAHPHPHPPSPRHQVCSLLESAGFSRSNPYYIVQQVRVRGWENHGPLPVPVDGCACIIWHGTLAHAPVIDRSPPNPTGQGERADAHEGRAAPRPAQGGGWVDGWMNVSVGVCLCAWCACVRMPGHAAPDQSSHTSVHVP